MTNPNRTTQSINNKNMQNEIDNIESNYNQTPTPNTPTLTNNEKYEEQKTHLRTILMFVMIIVSGISVFLHDINSKSNFI
ncbi:MAG: hypothetical protein ACI4TX_00345, partial [Christensenellales bacterium]